MKEVVELMKCVHRFEALKRGGGVHLGDLQDWMDTDGSKLFNLAIDLNNGVADLYDQIKKLEKEVEEAEERAHKAEQEIEKMTDNCTGCNRPAEYCGCDEDWRRDR